MPDAGRASTQSGLSSMGAKVVALDVSPTMLRLAGERLQGRARILQADLAELLTFLETASFDLIISALALDFVADWHAIFGEFFRVLRRSGILVFSSGHAADEFFEHHSGGNYFNLEQVEMDWKTCGCVTVPYYRRR